MAIFGVRVRGTSSVACAALLVALPGSAFAQEKAPTGIMSQSAASSGTSNVTVETFDAGKKPEDADDATEAKIQAGGLAASGNSRSLALTGLANLRVRRADNELSVAAAANYGRAAATPDDDMETSVENYQGKLRYDRFLSDRVAVFLSLSGRHDRFQGLDLRMNLDPGVAYYFVTGAKQQLWGELGYDFQYDVRTEEAIDTAIEEGDTLDKTNTRHSGRLFAGYRNHLNDNVSFDTGVEYLQGLPDTEFWRLNWDVGFTAAIATRFSLATTFSLKYDHEPLPGVRHTDTLTAVNLVYQLL